MAKQTEGYLGGFRGALGPAIGYMWNGRWCVRSRPSKVSNPRTPKQTEQRDLFRQTVAYAGRLGLVLKLGLSQSAREARMTVYNLFVRENKGAFRLADGALEVDYASLLVAGGPVAPVGFGAAATADGYEVEVAFESNPERRRVDVYDLVLLAAVNAEGVQCVASDPAARRRGRVALALPAEWAGQRAELYGFVRSREGAASPSCYLGSLVVGTAGLAVRPLGDAGEPSDLV